jgi:hypothetical protein
LEGIIFNVGFIAPIRRVCVVLMNNNPSVIEAHHRCKDVGFKGLFASTRSGDLINLKYELYSVYPSIQGYGPPNFNINGQRNGVQLQWLQFDTLIPIYIELPYEYLAGPGDCLKINLPPANDNKTTSSDCSLAEIFSICELVD